jgi:hypothetical protein
MATIPESVLNSPAIALSAGLFALFILTLFFVKRTRRPRKVNPTKTPDHEEKRIMGSRIVQLENVNTDLRDRLRSLEMEYLERQENIKKSENEIEAKTRAT